MALSNGRLSSLAVQEGEPTNSASQQPRAITISPCKGQASGEANQPRRNNATLDQNDDDKRQQMPDKMLISQRLDNNKNKVPFSIYMRFGFVSREKVWV